MNLRAGIGLAAAVLWAVPCFASLPHGPATLDSGVRELDLVQPKQLPPGLGEGGLAWIDPTLSLAAKDASEEVDILLELSVAETAAASSAGRPARADDALIAAGVEAAQVRMAAWSRSLGARDIEGLSHFPLMRMRVRAGSLYALAALPSVEAVHRNRPVAAYRQEGGGIIGAFTLQASGALGRGVGVAILDTGIEASHPELQGFVVAGGDFTGGADWDDYHGHGTACAGIVHAMAPEAHIWAIKVLNDEGVGNMFWSAAGLNAIFANRNQFGGVKVVSASLGGGGPVNRDCDKGNPLTKIVNALFKAGIVMVFASGNDAYLTGVSQESCLSKVIAVGAVYDGDIGPLQFRNCEDPTTRAGQIACYSNSGVPLDVLAPSHNSNTTHIQAGYNPTFGGTSAATPYVAGVIAQIRSRLPKATPAKIRNALMSTGQPIRDINGITRRLISGPAAYKKLGGK